MKFTALKIPGAYLIEPEAAVDERGSFAILYSPDEFRERGLRTDVSQSCVSFNSKKGTVRGLHYQVKPHEQAKVVRCSRGGVYDVILDLRPESPAYKRWWGVELTSQGLKSIYVPEGCAHGFQTLEDGVDVTYLLFGRRMSDCERGIRWDDPAFAIDWPLQLTVISPRDRSYAGFAG